MRGRRNSRSGHSWWASWSGHRAQVPGSGKQLLWVAWRSDEPSQPSQLAPRQTDPPRAHTARGASLDTLDPVRLTTGVEATSRRPKS